MNNRDIKNRVFPGKHQIESTINYLETYNMFEDLGWSGLRLEMVLLRWYRLFVIHRGGG